jgi:hypothetical protein
MGFCISFVLHVNAGDELVRKFEATEAVELFDCGQPGLGRALLKEALLRTAQAADIAGIRCLVVHAKDDAARQWCTSWEFEPSPTDAYHLYWLPKDIKALVAG